MRQIGPVADSGPGEVLPGGIRGDALILASGGRVPLHGLRPGDLVLTRDAGPQRIVAIHRRSAAAPGDRAVSISAQVLGATAELRLRGDQPVLLAGWLVAALFSDREVLARIGSFENGRHVRTVADEADYLVPEFAEPQIIRANGLWVACATAQGQARRLLTSAEEYSAAESGIFIRRPGEMNARVPGREAAYVH